MSANSLCVQMVVHALTRLEALNAYVRADIAESIARKVGSNHLCISNKKNVNSLPTIVGP